MLSETLPTGVAPDVGLSADELRLMIQSYYRARGWDDNGSVPETKLAELCLASNDVETPNRTAVIPLAYAG